MVRVIGVDHGFGYIKTAHKEFRTGVKEFSTEPPLMQRVVKYNGIYYAVGGSRNVVQTEKWEDDKYWIMTLAAIAEELGSQQEADVVLSVGLPLTRFGAGRDAFTRYLKRDGIITFEYEKRPYRIRIINVLVFPQGYSAIAHQMASLTGITIVVDVGSWTVDILALENGTPNMSRIISLDMGVIKAMNSINEELRRDLGGEVEETVLQDVMLGKEVKLPTKYMSKIKAELAEYANGVLAKLKELGFNFDTSPFVVTGGGSSTIKRYAQYDATMMSFMEDIHANAIGYERLARYKLGGKYDG